MGLAEIMPNTWMRTVGRGQHCPSLQTRPSRPRRSVQGALRHVRTAVLHVGSGCKFRCVLGVGPSLPLLPPHQLNFGPAFCVSSARVREPEGRGCAILDPSLPSNPGPHFGGIRNLGKYQVGQKGSFSVSIRLCRKPPRKLFGHRSTSKRLVLRPLSF